MGQTATASKESHGGSSASGFFPGGIRSAGDFHVSQTLGEFTSVMSLLVSATPRDRDLRFTGGNKINGAFGLRCSQKQRRKKVFQIYVHFRSASEYVVNPFLQHMKKALVTELKQLGLSAAEARIYLALLHNGGLSASALAHAIGAQRTTVYPILTSLAHKGIVEADEGYGSRFTAVAPDQALPFLIAREQEELLQRQRLAEEELLQRQHLADKLVEKLESTAGPASNNGETELIQVLRDPRVVAERFERLEMEVQQRMEVFCKPPVFIREGNPAQAKAILRGVRIRGLYERGHLDVEIVRSNLEKWLSDGEEARVYDGELPHKLAIFDRQTVLMPLITPSGQGRTLFIRNPQLAASLGMLFDFIWERSEPLSAKTSKTRKRISRAAIGQWRSKNGAARDRHAQPRKN